MRERLTMLLGMLLSAVFLFSLFGPRRGPGEMETRPVSDEPGPNGQLAARRWLEREGVATYSLRERFDVLNREERPTYGPGNLMIMVMPQLHHLRTMEVGELRTWVSAGNTLVLLAGLNDTPGWSYQGDSQYMHRDLAAITGISFSEKRPAGRSHGKRAPVISPYTELDKPLSHDVLVDDQHWLTEGIGTLRARSELPASRWEVSRSDRFSLFEIGWDPGDGRGVLWLIAEGDGQILVSSYASLFQNDVIGEAANRGLLANLVRFHVAPGKVVIFDDMHQGLSTLYDPAAFFGDPRLHHSLLFVLGLWLIYAIFGGNRLGAVAEPEPSRRQVDFVRSVGNFMARKVAPADAARRLFGNFLVERGSGDGTHLPGWQELAENPLLDDEVIARLRADFEALESGRRINLKRIQNDLARARRALH